MRSRQDRLLLLLRERLLLLLRERLLLLLRDRRDRRLLRRLLCDRLLCDRLRRLQDRRRLLRRLLCDRLRRLQDRRHLLLLRSLLRDRLRRRNRRDSRRDRRLLLLRRDRLRRRLRRLVADRVRSPLSPPRSPLLQLPYPSLVLLLSPDRVQSLLTPPPPPPPLGLLPHFRDRALSRERPPLPLQKEADRASLSYFNNRQER